MSATRNWFAIGFSWVFLALGAAPLWADPLTGEALKFQQLPLNNGLAPYVGAPVGATFSGHDVLSTAYWDPLLGLAGGWRGTFAADDFGDKVSTPVVHIRWWGSYGTDTTQPIPVPNFQGNGGLGVQKFLISFETDVPSVPGIVPFSQPGTVLSSQTVIPGALSPGSGTYTETLINGNVPEHIFQYNAELAVPFPEQKDTVYWLKIVALVDQATEGNIQWGWHNRDWTLQDTLASTTAPSSPGESNVGTPPSPVWHYQDDAVTGVVNIFNLSNGGFNVVQPSATFVPTNYTDGIDGPAGFIGGFSQDLAFELYTPVPEPSTFVLGGLGLVGLVVARRRMRQPAAA